MAFLNMQVLHAHGAYYGLPRDAPQAEDDRIACKLLQSALWTGSAAANNIYCWSPWTVSGVDLCSRNTAILLISAGGHRHIACNLQAWIRGSS